LDDFLSSHDTIIKQGLMGGVLSSAWPLLSMAAKNPKLSYAGIKKINDRQAHQLKYTPRRRPEDQPLLGRRDFSTFMYRVRLLCIVRGERRARRPHESKGEPLQAGRRVLGLQGRGQAHAPAHV
jgi:hypothetical protein